MVGEHICNQTTLRSYYLFAEDADVIPLQVNGTADIDLSKVSAAEIMQTGLANLWNASQEGPYTIRHGRRPVTDFGQLKSGGAQVKNYFERAFPCLYPYGRGSIEANRTVQIDFKDHVKWSLQYHDRRFRKHQIFPFVAFGILQRREALGVARLQMHRKNFEHEAHIIAGVTKEKLVLARMEEEQGKPISDPSVRLLRKNVLGALGRVMGSNQSRYRMRSQIWSTSVHLGPPSLWVTINPSDLNNPIAQVFAGEKIDVDNFLSSMGPGSETRARNIADDPYAASKFFHFLIHVILETLFNIKIEGHRVKSGIGILGRVAAYFGLVDSQGQGMLHLHILIWLVNAPTSDEMAVLLQDSAFRDRIVSYIQANLRSYLPGLENMESVQAVQVENDVAYSWPPNPDSIDYACLIGRDEIQLAKTEQLHTCKPRRCLVVDRAGRIQCKRRAPFHCMNEDYILESGEWGSKRLYGYINSWIPGVLINARCNNDVKLLTNGHETKNITYYVTTYAAKKQGKSYNIAAVLAQGHAHHVRHPVPEYVNHLLDQSRLLTFRLVSAINREQELAAVMVMSYLMGWGDVFRSHTYSPIFWSTFVRPLLQIFPALAQQAS